ncbi:MAG: molybdopterin-binding protein [Anaerolineae bacterium]|nr:molybdopterin-binding protein [Thermoflexales bacterium]MDW8396028.1 molybdopterin-binding protein [Anaerolineae bacterium]
MLNTDLRTVEIFAIGNELLIGQVMDTNSHWLIRMVTGLGARVNRVAIIRDDYDHIGSELTAALQRGPRLILTTGGLGPTEDDLTVRAIARALNLELREDSEALEMVRQRYAYLASIRPNVSPELNAARRKMALFPVGATPLRNPEGAAPGMALDAPSNHPDGITTIVALPGVPSEMKAIFTTSLQPVLERTIGAGGYLEHTIVLDKGDESRIAELLREVQAHHPAVYVKSRGQRASDGSYRLTVVLSMGGNNLALIRDEVLATEQEAIEGLTRLGYTVLQIVES